MSRERTSGLLLRLYPAGYRARYGAELEALILETSGDTVSWRMRVDVALAAGRERLHAGGLHRDSPSGEQARGGALLVLCAWAAFVVAGVVVANVSEHWQGAVAGSARGVPRVAFDVLLAGAVAGSVLVVAGAAATLPALVRLLRAGGVREVRRHLLAVAATTAVAAGALAGLVTWAHRLTVAQRNGHDTGYAVAFAICGVLLVVCLAAWTAAGVALARRLDLAARTLRVEALLAAATAAAMTATTAATAVWWAAVARSAPSFLGGGSPAPITAAALMLVATVAALAGAGRSLRGAAADGH